MSTAIKFDNISKQYRLGLVSTNTIGHDLNRWWQTSIRGKEDPYLKIGDVNDRSTKADSDYVWALRDISFEVQQGDVLGIIGKNGAGKSTLLKILSKVTAPTTGIIRANGRIASLLEVGTGFHPEMTGRENIYMNGAILGMTKPEIRRKLDEIVDFSGVERYIDTPTKRYSSGMTVRLGFAIAAHLDPEILVVDEVLAVGDAEFQKKAIGKMQDVSKGEGRTVLFVSHNMGAVRNLCKTGIVLNNGMLDFSGNVNQVVDYYLSKNQMYENVVFKEFRQNNESLKEMQFLSVKISKGVNAFASDEKIEFELVIKANFSVKAFRLNSTILTLDEIPVGSVSGKDFFSINEGDVKTIKFVLTNHNLALGDYFISFSVGTGNLSTGQRDFDVIHNVLVFKIDKYSYITNEAFVQWSKTWGNIAFEAKTEIF